MDNNFGSFKAARLPVITTNKLPGDITSAKINTAILPAQLEAARRQIAECTSLDIWAGYRDKAEGLAAAVRAMKQVGPEMIRQANEIMADAWRKGGELLSQYSGIPEPIKGKGGGGTLSSPRHAVGEKAGLSPKEIKQMVRIHKAPIASVYAAAQHSASISKVALRVPSTRLPTTSPRSESFRLIMGGGGYGYNGLIQISSILRNVEKQQQQLKFITPDERKIVKMKITEIMELLDKMDQLCR